MPHKFHNITNIGILKSSRHIQIFWLVLIILKHVKCIEISTTASPSFVAKYLSLKG